MASANEVIIHGLGDRMKQYEKLYDTHIDKSHYYIVRLDGCSFSKYCRPLRKPFDINFIKAIARTQNELMLQFNALTSYSHSDEISLIFDRTFDDNTHHADGRIQKIIPQTSSFCSVRFNHHMNEICKNDEDCLYRGHVAKNKAFFDARIVSFDQQYEAANYILWRSVRDCERNAISTYAQQYYSTDELHGKSMVERIEMLLEQGLDWAIIPTYIKHGIYGKRHIKCKLLHDNNKPILVKKTQYVLKNFKIICNDDNINALFSKSWTHTVYDNKSYDVNHLLIDPDEVAGMEAVFKQLNFDF